MKKILSAVMFAILLAATGFLIHPYFTKLSFYQLNGISIQTMETDTPVMLTWFFAISLACIPMFYLAMQQIMKIVTRRQQVFAIAAIVATGIIFWQFKLNSLNMRYQELTSVKTPFPMKYYFAREDLNLEMYLLMGFMIGGIIGGIALHRYRLRNKL